MVYFIASEHNVFIISLYLLGRKSQRKKEIPANLCIPRVLQFTDSSVDIHIHREFGALELPSLSG